MEARRVPFPGQLARHSACTFLDFQVVLGRFARLPAGRPCCVVRRSALLVVPVLAGRGLFKVGHVLSGPSAFFTQVRSPPLGVGAEFFDDRRAPWRPCAAVRRG